VSVLGFLLENPNPMSTPVPGNLELYHSSRDMHRTVYPWTLWQQGSRTYLLFNSKSGNIVRNSEIQWLSKLFAHP
jgi:hypothetical protein